MKRIVRNVDMPKKPLTEGELLLESGLLSVWDLVRWKRVAREALSADTVSSGPRCQCGTACKPCNDMGSAPWHCDACTLPVPTAADLIPDWLTRFSFYFYMVAPAMAPPKAPIAVNHLPLNAEGTTSPRMRSRLGDLSPPAHGPPSVALISFVPPSGCFEPEPTFGFPCIPFHGPFKRRVVGLGFLPDRRSVQCDAASGCSIETMFGLSTSVDKGALRLG
jgi:hypothetical protein